MTISDRERVGRGLTLLNQGLYPYVKREMQKVYGADWLKEAVSCLSKEKSRRNSEEILSEDISVLLKVIVKHWEPVFKISYENRVLVYELIEIRNKWAHQSHFSTDDTYRAIDTITRLLKAISATEVKIAEQYKQEVLILLCSKSTEKRKKENLVEVIQKAKFDYDSLLRRALTHRSYVHEHPQEGEHNERLEFLGDALLTYLSGDYLYRRHPEVGEDELTRRRSALVDEKQLSRFALEVGLDKKMRLGKGAIREGGYKNPNLLSSTFEAVIAAYYIDNNSDIEALRDVIEPLFDSVPEEIVEFRSHLDPINQLQVWVQRHIPQNPPNLPDYIITKTGGVPHAPEFLCEVIIDNKKYGEGRGKNTRKAKKAAAIDALSNLEEEGFI